MTHTAIETETGTETQQMLSDAVERLLERHHDAAAPCEGKPKADLWEAMVEIGLPAAELPEEHGGLGLSLAQVAPVLGKAGQKLATTYFTEFAVMGGWLLNACASEATASLLGLCASGEARITLAFAEAGDGFDPRFTRTTAMPSGDGWSLTGTKQIVVGADRASHAIVPAMVAHDGSVPHGELALFLVPLDLSGVTRHCVTLYDGSHGADIVLDAVVCPQSGLLARGKKAIDLLDLALDRGRAALCHEVVGLLEAVLDITVSYVKTRRQFGQAIGAFQTMQHRMADIYMDLELARACAQMATEAASAETDAVMRKRTVSAAMVSLCDHARRVGQSAVQAHGGIALTQEYLVGHYFKRLTMAQRYLGDGEFHLHRYITLAA